MGVKRKGKRKTAVSGKRADQTDIYMCICVFIYICFSILFFVSFAFAALATAISVFLYAIVRPLARFGIAAAFRPLFQLEWHH